MTDPLTAPIRLDPARVRRILVCQLRQLGDVILSTPSVRLLSEAFPAAELHYFTENKCAPLLAHNPRISRIWSVDKEAHRHLPQALRFYRQVVSQGFDLVVDFQQLPRCRWVVAFSRAPVRLSYTPPWYNRWLYTHTIDPLPGYSAMSRASLLRVLGLTWQQEPPELYLTPEEREWSGTFLAGLGLQPGEGLVTIDPSHRRKTRRWPAEHFGAFISLAAQRRPDLKFLLLFGPGEEQDVQAVLRSTDRPDRCLIPPRLLSLREMGACLERALAHVGNCSAPRHMAVALGTPTLTVLGATSKAWTFPSPLHRHVAAGLSCQPCNRNECPDCRCLTELAPGRVADAFRDLLDDIPSRA